MVEVVYVIIVIWGFIVLMRVGGSLGVRYGVVVFLYVIVGVQDVVYGRNRSGILDRGLVCYYVWGRGIDNGGFIVNGWGGGWRGRFCFFGCGGFGFFFLCFLLLLIFGVFVFKLYL